MPDKRSEELKSICNEIINLKKSPLYKSRIENKYYPVVGEGNHYSKIIFVGEAPGENEARTGRPFCGRSGKVLDELLNSIGISRSDVYVTNIVKDRPPLNRDPKPDEIALYSPFLLRQINIIQPTVIATLGRYSMVYIMENFGLTSHLEPISKIHGQMFEVDTPNGTITIVPLYHPAVALYNGGTKEELKKDFEILRKLI